MLGAPDRGAHRRVAGARQVQDGANTLLHQDVPLAYGAAFGPDIDDVAAWESACIQAIDGRTEQPPTTPSN